MIINDSVQQLIRNLRANGAWAALAPTPEAWHIIGYAGEPAFQNGWDHYGAPIPGAAFFKDPFGVVHIQGGIKSGTVGATAFTLPAGYRPAGQLVCPADTPTGHARVDIYTTGEVYVVSGSNAFISLMLTPFRAA